MNKPILEIKNLEVRYPSSSESALTVDELELYEGETVLILGKSGSGKSTLGKVISGVIPHIEKAYVKGIVKVCDIDPRVEDINSIIHVVTYLAQSPYDQIIFTKVIDEIKTVLENIKGVANEEDIDKLLKILNIENLKYKKVSELSGGEVQKVAISCILAIDPKIVILDEPLAHLDSRSCREFKNILQILKSSGKTTILIEHRFREVVRFIEDNLIDRIVILHNHKIVNILNPYEIYENIENLKKLGISIPINLEVSKLLGENIEKYTDYKPVEKVLNIVRNRYMLGSNHELEDNCSTLKICNLYAGYIAKIERFKRSILWILEDINVEFRGGLVYGIAGPNGAGKSTLLKAIIRQVPYLKGRIIFNGRIVKSIDDIRGIVGFVPQNPDLILMHETVYEEIFRRALIKYRSVNDAKRRVLEISKIFNIDNLLHRCPHSLSRGQRFRVAIASIFAYDPDILLLDEPTVGQDEECIEVLGEVLRNYVKDKSKIVIIVTHDTNFLIDYVDKLLLISNGKIVCFGNPIDILSRRDILDTVGLVVNEYACVASRCGVYIRPRQLLDILYRYLRENAS